MVLTLHHPLRYRHGGEILEGVDERAEAGLLNHNVTIQGDAPSPLAARGGYVMIMSSATARDAARRLRRQRDGEWRGNPKARRAALSD